MSANDKQLSTFMVNETAALGLDGGPEVGRRTGAELHASPRASRVCLPSVQGDGGRELG
eukprot:COSAG04_NODE_1965_length_5118_cov_14.211994_3_plen_59_part_00